MTDVVRHPLSWYVDKLERREPFTSLLYGDGEFLVAAGVQRREGEPYQNGEVPSEYVRHKVIDSLSDPDPTILRGTDPHLVQYDTYMGTDREFFVAMAKRVEHVYPINAGPWYDGTVWETACQRGELGPLIKALGGRNVVLVANRRVAESCPFRYSVNVEVPWNNACSEVDRLADETVEKADRIGDGSVFVVCAGFATIPYVMKLRWCNPSHTFLDLGSTFDLFARIGSRGWQQDLYRDKRSKDWRTLVDANMRGSR